MLVDEGILYADEGVRAGLSVIRIDVDLPEFTDHGMGVIDHRRETKLDIRRFEYGIALEVHELRADGLREQCLPAVPENIGLARYGAGTAADGRDQVPVHVGR